jgi:hypothetical protein
MQSILRNLASIVVSSFRSLFGREAIRPKRAWPMHDLRNRRSATAMHLARSEPILKMALTKRVNFIPGVCIPGLCRPSFHIAQAIIRTANFIKNYHRRIKGARRARLFLEQLETRLTPANLTFTGGFGTSWNVENNWTDLGGSTRGQKLATMWLSPQGLRATQATPIAWRIV